MISDELLGGISTLIGVGGLVIAGIFARILLQGLKRGEFALRRGVANRAKDPFAFWFLVFCMALATTMLTIRSVGELMFAATVL